MPELLAFDELFIFIVSLKNKIYINIYRNKLFFLIFQHLIVKLINKANHRTDAGERMC